VRQYLVGLGEDVQVKEPKNYIAFKRLENFTCAEIYPQVRVVTLYLRIDPTTVELEDGFSRDVTKIGHFGTGNLELSLRRWKILPRRSLYYSELMRARKIALSALGENKRPATVPARVFLAHPIRSNKQSSAAASFTTDLEIFYLLKSPV
jgi:predicted transport protein